MRIGVDERIVVQYEASSHMPADLVQGMVVLELWLGRLLTFTNPVLPRKMKGNEMRLLGSAIQPSTGQLEFEIVLSWDDIYHGAAMQCVSSPSPIVNPSRFQSQPQ